MAVQHLATGDLRQALGVAADLEEGRVHAFCRQRIEDFRGADRVGAIIEGQDHLVIGERDRLGIRLQANLKSALGSDLRDA